MYHGITKSFDITKVNRMLDFGMDGLMSVLLVAFVYHQSQPHINLVYRSGSPLIYEVDHQIEGQPLKFLAQIFHS